MVAGKGTKNGSADLTVAILRGIRDEIVGLRKDTDAMRIELKAEIAGLRAETGQLRQGLEDLETVTIQGFRGVATRLEAIQDVTAKQYGELRERIEDLEAWRKRGERGP